MNLSKIPSVFHSAVLLYSKKHPLQKRFTAMGIPSADVATYLGVKSASISNYLLGRRPFPPELKKRMTALVERLERDLLGE